MYTVYVAAEESLRTRLVERVKGYSGAVVLGSSDYLRQALDECGGENPGILIVHDALLSEAPGLIEVVADVAYPVILIASESPGSTRRALAIRARDLIPLESWDAELESALARYATPLEGGEVAQGVVITVFSTKGGVGKSTISLNLAVALATLSHRAVALVDLDVAAGDLGIMLGNPSQASIYDLVEEGVVERAKLERVLTPIPDTTLKFLPAPFNPQEAEDVTAEHVVTILRLLKEHYSYVVVDTAPGYSEINVASLDASDSILMVATPDVVTIRTVSQALNLFYGGFRYPRTKIELVMNRDGSHTGVTTEDVERMLNNPIRYRLASDGLWPVKAANEGRPLMLLNGSSLLSRGIRQMAREFIDRYSGPSRAIAVRSGAKAPWWKQLLARGR